MSSAPLPLDVAAALGDGFEFEAPSRQLERSEFLARAATADALITLLTDPVNTELFDACPNLRIVANCAVGFDNVDVAEATRRGVVVTNTPGVLTDATADFAFTLLLAAARRVVEGDRLVRAGTWSGWKPTELLGAAVAGRTLGIVGMGRIGRAMARRGRGFDMRVLFSGGSDDDGIAEPVALSQLLAESDFISIHCPLTPETHHLIDAAALTAMKSTAIVVNTARGPIVDEAALVAALDAGTIAGAGLDVFEREPEVHPGLLANDRVVLAPHAGSATTSTRGLMATMCTSAIKTLFSGGTPTNIVNVEVAP